MNEKIWIFGDSYASRLPQFENSWPIMLEKYYDVKNYAIGGTGVDWSLEQMFIAYEKADIDTKDVTVLFFVSSQKRQNFSFWTDPEHQFLTTEIVANQFLSGEKEVSQLKKKYRHYKKFCKRWMLSLSPLWGMLEQQKNLGMINMWAPRFKKVLVIYCFNKPNTENLKLNPNLHIFSKTMKDIYPLPDKIEVYDMLANHMPVEYHKIVFDKLTDWIENNVQI